MFSQMKMKEYMKPELCIIFRLKSVAKNMVLGPTGSRFMHARVRFDLCLLVDFMAAILWRKRLQQGFSQHSLENPKINKMKEFRHDNVKLRITTLQFHLRYEMWFIRS